MSDQALPFYGLVIECDSTASIHLLDEGCDACASRPEPGCDVCGREDGAAWAALLKRQRGYQDAQTLTRYRDAGGCGPLESEATEALGTLKKAAGTQPSRLVLVYTGLSRLKEPADGGPGSNPFHRPRSGVW